MSSKGRAGGQRGKTEATREGAGRTTQLGRPRTATSVRALAGAEPTRLSTNAAADKMIDHVATYRFETYKRNVCYNSSLILQFFILFLVAGRRAAVAALTRVTAIAESRHDMSRGVPGFGICLEEEIEKPVCYHRLQHTLYSLFLVFRRVWLLASPRS